MTSSDAPPRERSGIPHAKPAHTTSAAIALAFMMENYHSLAGRAPVGADDSPSYGPLFRVVVVPEIVPSSVTSVLTSAAGSVVLYVMVT